MHCVCDSVCSRHRLLWISTGARMRREERPLPRLKKDLEDVMEAKREASIGNVRLKLSRRRSGDGDGTAAGGKPAHIKLRISVHFMPRQSLTQQPLLQTAIQVKRRGYCGLPARGQLACPLEGTARYAVPARYWRVKVVVLGRVVSDVMLCAVQAKSSSTGDVLKGPTEQQLLSTEAALQASLRRVRLLGAHTSLCDFYGCKIPSTTDRAPCHIFLTTLSPHSQPAFGSSRMAGPGRIVIMRDLQ